jgi:heme/copper-type cytochrome/quinol oxidase subunit 2
MQTLINPIQSSVTWIKNNPIQTTVNVSAVLFIVFVILAIISYFKVNDAKKEGKEAAKGWVELNTASYIIFSIIALIIMIIACSQSSFNCLFIFLLFNNR